MNSSKWDEQKSQDWFYFIRAVQDFFLSKGFCPIETPILVESPGTEPHLDFFSTIKKHNKLSQKKWLSASPEMNLKKILCRGGKNIFEIHKCFRNNESGSRHLSEFYMLEWYRANALLTELMNDLENLLKYLKQKHIILFALKPFQRLSISELFKTYCEVDLNPKSQAKDLIPALEKWNIPFDSSGTFEEFFHLLFLNKIENQFVSDVPTIVQHYPPSLRAYSRLNHEGWAERFEFYWQGLELANAFYEICDSQEQQKVFQQDLQIRKDKGVEEVAVDQEFLLEMKDMPESSGIALGLERLFMAVSQKKDISQIHPFS
ncbi:MAG: EF-P lysine aminoacylase GenX [Bdellovibrionales bacterium]|nr:EF-P lysine aminoacylase GenX [Bdellovibrionales bacterium]